MMNSKKIDADEITTKRLCIVDDKGKVKASLETLDPDGIPIFQLYDDNNVARVSIGMDGVNCPHVSIMDADWNVVANMKLRDNNEVFIGIYKDGKTIFSSGVDINGDSFLECNGKKIN